MTPRLDPPNSQLARLARRFSELSPNLRGACWMLAAGTGFTLNGAMVKWLAKGDMDPFQIAFARAFFALLPLLPFLYRGGLRVFRTRHPFIHLTRGIAGGGAMLCGFYALAHLPLADVTALGFTQPLFTLLLAVLLLNEKVRWRRWSATAVGFLGVLIMVRPGAGSFDPAALVALAMAFGIALAVTLVKRFPPGESQAAMLFYFCIASILMSGPLALASWRDPTAMEWLLLVGVGFVGVASQAMIIRAYRTGEATFIAPIDYTKLLMAGFVGYSLFGELPDLWTLAGALIIVASTLYILRREARQGGKTVISAASAPTRPPAT